MVTILPVQTTYTNARANLAKLCNQVTDDRDIVVIQRRDAEDVALIAASELRSLLETVHLFSSSNNANRLMAALARAEEGTLSPESPQSLRDELMLDEEEESNGLAES